MQQNHNVTIPQWHETLIILSHYLHANVNLVPHHLVQNVATQRQIGD